MYVPVDPRKILEEKNYLYELKCSIAPSSLIHIESLATEYMKKWYLEHFNPNFFKTVYIGESHILSEFRKMKDMVSFINKPKPALSITPLVDFDFDDDMHNINLFGSQNQINKSRLDSSFIKDFDNNSYLAMGIEMIQINYNIHIHTKTRAQQVDTYNKMKLNFPIGSTVSNRIDMDFIIPKNIMYQMASDVGFDITTNDDRQCAQFLTYLNSKSELPIIYKYRSINGEYDYFVRMRGYHIKIDMTDRMSLDDGEMDNQVSTNFGIDHRIVVRLLGPSMFAYYSKCKHDLVEKYISKSEFNDLNISIPLIEIPNKNEKGWNVFITTQYQEMENNINPVIDFTELFDAYELTRFIKMSLENNISPREFIDIKTYNADQEYQASIDWTTLKCSYEGEFTSTDTHIALYIDSKYVNELTVILDKLDSNRIVQQQ